MPEHDETLLELAQRHVTVGESLVAEQRAIIARLRSQGDSTGDAERLLATMEETLRLMRKHLAYEQSRRR